MTLPEDDPVGPVLHSWKEIADHLHVTVRTAQRWRDEGMPVHYLGPGPRPRVAARTLELDAWIAEARVRRTGETSVPKQEPPPGNGAVAAVSSRLGPLFLGWGLGVLVLAAAAFAGFWWVALRPGAPARASVEGSQLAVYDSANRPVMRLELPGIDPDAYSLSSELTRMTRTPASYDATRVEDIDGDGSPEILVNFWPDRRSSATARLICFARDGSLRWESPFGRERTFGDRVLGGTYRGIIFRSFSAYGRRWVLSISHHDHWFPARVAVLEAATGRLHQEYWHPGWLLSAEVLDTDGDGEPEIVASGYNNPGGGLGHAGLVVLGVARSPQPPVEDRAGADVAGFSGPGVRAYALFPRSDVHLAAGEHPFAERLRVLDGQRLHVRVVGPDGTAAIYHLDFGLRVVDFQLSDNFRSVHERYEHRGLLDHPVTDEEIAGLRRVLTFTTTPDGNSPDLAAAWARDR